MITSKKIFTILVLLAVVVLLGFIKPSDFLSSLETAQLRGIKLEEPIKIEEPMLEISEQEPIKTETQTQTEIQIKEPIRIYQPIRPSGEYLTAPPKPKPKPKSTKISKAEIKKAKSALSAYSYTNPLFDSTGQIYEIQRRIASPAPEEPRPPMLATALGRVISFPKASASQAPKTSIDQPSVKQSADADGVLVEFKEPSVLEKKAIMQSQKGFFKIIYSPLKLKQELQRQEARISEVQKRVLNTVQKRFGAFISLGKNRKISQGGKIKMRVYKDAFSGFSLTGEISVKEAKELLESLPEVKRVVPNGRAHIALLDTVSMTNTDSVWGYPDTNGVALDGTGMRVGVLDSGVDYSHPDLGGCFGSGCKVAGGYDFVNEDADPMDDGGHGTHVAATIAGDGQITISGNQTPIYGMAPGAELYSYKVCDSSGTCFFDDIIAAIEACADPNDDGDYSDRLDVCNLSLGGGGNPDDPLSLAVDNATLGAGVLFAIAAGNAGPGPETIGSPGAAREAVTVAAACKTADIGVDITCDDPIADFSSRGPVRWTDANGIEQTLAKPDISAPGHKICAAQWDDAWDSRACGEDGEHVAISGTSMATPHVAGIAALIRQAHPEFSPEQVKQVLMQSASDLGLDQNTQGMGLVDSMSALSFSGIPSSLVRFSGLPVSFVDPVTQQIQSFSKTITIENTSGGTLTVIPQVPPAIEPGWGISFSNPSITLDDGLSFDLTIDFTVDHSVVESPTVLSEEIIFNLSTPGGNPLDTVQVGVRGFVRDRLTANVDKLDFELDPADVSSWSSQRFITLQNTPTDLPGTYSISFECCSVKDYYSSLSNDFIGNGGVSFSAQKLGAPPSSTIEFSPGEEETLRIDISANNNILGTLNGRYSGNLVLSSPLHIFKIPIIFWKGYAIEADYTGGAPYFIQVYETDPGENGYAITYPLQNVSKTRFYLYTPGPWDMYGYWRDITGFSRGFSVIEEGIFPGSAVEYISMSKNQAVNEISFDPVLPGGRPGYLKFLASILLRSKSIGMVDSYGFSTVPYFISDVSSKYAFNLSGTSLNFDRNGIPFDFPLAYLTQITGGISSNVLITNSPNDYVSKRVFAFPNKDTSQTSSLSVAPVLYLPFEWEEGTSLVNASFYVGGNPQTSFDVNPFGSQKTLFVYSDTDMPDQSLYGDFPAFKLDLSIGPADWSSSVFDKIAFESDHYNITSTDTFRIMWPGFKFIDNYFGMKPQELYERFGLPEPPGGALYVGAGPVFDSTHWFNYANIAFPSHISYLALHGLISRPFGPNNLWSGGAREFSSLWNQYGKEAVIDYVIKRDGVVVDQGSGGWFMTLSVPFEEEENLIDSRIPLGSYEFEMTRQATINGVKTNIKTESSFDIVGTKYQQIFGPVDENPPALSELNLLANGLWQNIIDPTITNALEFEVDPVPGLLTPQNIPGEATYTFMRDSLSQVSLEMKTSGGARPIGDIFAKIFGGKDGGWESIPIKFMGASGSKEKYQATIPIDPGATLYSFRISAEDLQGNTFRYAFQLPTGTVVTPPPSPLPQEPAVE